MTPVPGITSRRLLRWLACALVACGLLVASYAVVDWFVSDLIDFLVAT